MNKIIISAAVLIGILGFANLGMAAQRMITEQGLDRAYQARITSLKAQDQANQDAYKKAQITMQKYSGQNVSKLEGKNKTEYQTAKVVIDAYNKNDFQSQKAQIDLMYQFMKDSLQ